MKRALFVLLVWCPVAKAGIESLNPFSSFAPKDASNFTTKITSTIKDRPECQKFKNEIMSYAKGSPTNGKVMHSITDAKRRATEAGCAK